MGRIGEQLGIEFVISVGDNFYDTGLTGADDPAFTASFTDVYTSPSLQTVWYSGTYFSLLLEVLPFDVALSQYMHSKHFHRIYYLL
jgi:hypothetical protein